MTNNTSTTTTTIGAHVRLLSPCGRLFAGAVGVVVDVPAADTITLAFGRVGSINVDTRRTRVELTTDPQTTAAGCGREHAVPCQGIGHNHRPMTWNASGLCDEHLTGERGAF